MHALTLKLIAGAAALTIGGVGVSVAVRSRHSPNRGLASPRARAARAGQPLTVIPDRVPVHMPVATAPPLQAALPEVEPAPSVTADSWEPAAPARPLTAKRPRAGARGSALTARPPSGLRMPATAMAPPVGRPITGVAVRPIPEIAPSAPPVTSPGALGFQEEPAAQRNPLITLVNCEADTLVITLRGTKRYRRVLAPRATVQLQIEPGEYAVRVHATRSSPNSGVGVFREFHRYTARWVSVPTGQAKPLRLGELAHEQEREPQEEEPLVKPVPEEPSPQ